VSYWVRITQGAQTQADELADWFHLNASAQVAFAFEDSFHDAAADLAEFPAGHPFDEEMKARHRSIPGFRRYRLWFQLSGHTVLVLAVTHEAMGKESVLRRLQGK
jgi:plasmid stabilization system protein ParE